MKFDRRTGESRNNCEIPAQPRPRGLGCDYSQFFFFFCSPFHDCAEALISTYREILHAFRFTVLKLQSISFLTELRHVAWNKIRPGLPSSLARQKYQICLLFLNFPDNRTCVFRFLEIYFSLLKQLFTFGNAIFYVNDL